MSQQDVLALGKFKPGSAPACTLMCVHGELDPGLNNEFLVITVTSRI